MNRIILSVLLPSGSLLVFGCSRAPDPPAAAEKKTPTTHIANLYDGGSSFPSQAAATDTTEGSRDNEDHRLNAKTPRDSPEAVLRGFLIAIAERDQETGTQLMLPNPEAEILWQGNWPSLAAAPSAKEYFQSIVFRRLQVGDTVTLPGGRALILDERHVNENRQQITCAENPVPFIMVRGEGGWKVDAGTIIAARKAATAARRPGPATPQTLRDPSAVGPSDWHPDRGDLERLASPFELPGFEIRPPDGFRLIKSDLVPGGTTLWTGPFRDDETYAHFMVIITTLSEKHSKRPLEVLLKEVMAPIQQRRQKWTKTAPERGRVNGLTFVRARWRGVATSVARKGLSGRQMHGFVYLAVDGQKAIQIMCQDVEPDHAESLRTCEAAALTIRKTTTPSPQHERGR